MSRTRLRVLIVVAILTVSGVITGPAAPAVAGGAGATMGMPFTGWWDRFGWSHPSSHGPSANTYADWATDIYQAPGTAVRPRFTGSGLALKVASVAPTCGSAGYTVVVDVHTDGVWVGTARYGHLSAVPVAAGQWISPDTVIGYLAQYANQSGCWEVTTSAGVHTHVTGYNKTDYSCYYDVGSGANLGEGTAIGVVGGAYASAPRSRCSGRVGSPPFGNADSVTSPTPGAITLRGWAIDPDTATAPVTVHAYVGGPAGTAGAEGHDLGPATADRPDVAAAHPSAGRAHGFDVTVSTAKVGAQDVCLYALDTTGTAANTLLGCRSVTVMSPHPFGGVDDATGGVGTLHVRGWAIDADAPATATSVHVYVGGPAGTAGAEVFVLPAGLARADIGTAYPWAGPGHGFEQTLVTARRGAQEVCVYAINLGAGSNQGLGCRVTTVAHGPRLVPVSPGRILDTRNGTGVPAGALGASRTLDLQVTGVGGVPATGVTAVALNVTATGASSVSYVTAYPSGAARPLASNLNLAPGDTTPNMVVVPVGAGGRVTLYNDAGSTHLIADVAGYWTGSGGSAYVPLVPERLLDTRIGNGAPAAAVGGGSTLELQVAGRTGVPTTGVTAVALNLTAVGTTGVSYVTAFPTGEVRPTASNLNLAPGLTSANFAIVKLGAGGKVSLYNDAGSTHLVADVAGYFTTGPGGELQALSPTRILDTRVGTGAAPLAVGPGASIDLQVRGAGGVPAQAGSAAVLNVTAVGATWDSYVTVYPTGAARPTASNLNLSPGRTSANLVTVKVGAGGKVTLYNNSGTTHLIADVAGYYAP